MEIRPILSALLRNKTGPLLVAAPGRAQPRDPGQRAAHRERAPRRRRAPVAASPTSTRRSTSRCARLTNDSARAAAGQQQARRPTCCARCRGVASVAQVSQMPLSRTGSNSSVAVDRKQTRETTHQRSTYVSGDSLVKTFGLKLVEGRDFLPQELVDVDRSAPSDEYPHSVIVTKPLAEKLWPGAAARSARPCTSAPAPTPSRRAVVGVVERLQSPQRRGRRARRVLGRSCRRASSATAAAVRGARRAGPARPRDEGSRSGAAQVLGHAR